jgi:hypothetical protein
LATTAHIKVAGSKQTSEIDMRSHEHPSTAATKGDNDKYQISANFNFIHSVPDPICQKRERRKPSEKD